MKYNTIIFDLDGTLLDTLTDLAISVNYTLTYYGYPTRTLDEIRDFVDDGASVLLRRCLPKNTSPEIHEKCMSCFRNYYSNHLFDHTIPYDGIIELLEFLKTRGCRLAVASNKLDIAVRNLTKHFFSPYIDVAVGAPPRAKKPDPYVIYQVMNALDARLNKTLYVGDSEIDVETARNIEIPGIMVSWGFRGKEWLIDYGVDHITDTAEDLRKLICNL